MRLSPVTVMAGVTLGSSVSIVFFGTRRNDGMRVGFVSTRAINRQEPARRPLAIRGAVRRNHDHRTTTPIDDFEHEIASICFY
jgi:hypothetical protein